MSELIIRPALVADAAEVAQVQHESWCQAYRSLLPKDFPLRTQDERILIWEKRITAHPCQTLLAERNGSLLGFIYWESGTERNALLRSLYLHPFFWRQGIGSRLLLQALDDMRQQGFRRVGLWVLANNLRAERFYLRQGFHYDGQLQTRSFGSGSYQNRFMVKLL
jgi:RimJ/RimL family protein N-acetyltransferase